MRLNSHNNLILNVVTMLGDIAICALLYIAFLMADNFLDTANVRMYVIFVTMVYAIFVFKHGVILYRRNTRDFQIPLLVLRNVVYFGVTCSLLFYLGGGRLLTWGQRLLFLALLFVGSSVYRLCIRFMVKLYRRKDSHVHRVVLVGSTANNVALFKELTGVPYLGYRVDGYFDFEENQEFSQRCPYLGKPAEVVGYLKANRDVHELYCCLPSRHQDIIVDIIHYCVNNLVHFYSVPNVRNYLHHRMYFNMLGNVPYLSFYREPLSMPENRMLKRAFDIVFSLAFLCTLFPFVFVIVAVITKLTMPGPIFFRQKRNGLNGREFYCIKFRSMKVNADADKLQATKNDPRKTKWGDIMRKTNIDELPQFINVLKGDMSVVGPRPHMLKHTEEYSKLIDKYMVRHFVKPGITGWSQVTGFRGETKELAQMEGRVKGDIWYIEHWSFSLDLYIIYKTVANAVKGDDEAY